MEKEGGFERSGEGGEGLEDESEGGSEDGIMRPALQHQLVHVITTPLRLLHPVSCVVWLGVVLCGGTVKKALPLSMCILAWELLRWRKGWVPLEKTSHINTP